MAKLAIEDVKNRYEDQLLGQEGIVGIGTGKTSTGEMCIKVYIIEKTQKVEVVIPKELEGYKVEIEEVGEIKAL